MPRVIVAVAGGFGREVAAYARDAGFEIGGFLHDIEKYPHSLDGVSLEAPVLGPAESYQPRPGELVAIGLGDAHARSRLAALLLDRGARLATIVHPTAWIAPTATLGDGVVAAPFVFVGPGARVGALSILNTHASVGHDSITGRCCVLAPHAVTGGGATLEDEVLLATHAVVTPSRRVGARSAVSAGSVVFQDVGPDSLAAGNPARARTIYSHGCE
jgi:sugar O-acyltransferase (sialic acid O-acetyltransferase NeuD family)